MSLTGWLNSINRENQERWKELRYDQVAVDFVKTLRTFPVLKAWSDTFAEELLMKLDPEQCQTISGGFGGLLFGKSRHSRSGCDCQDRLY